MKTVVVNYIVLGAGCLVAGIVTGIALVGIQAFSDEDFARAFMIESGHEDILAKKGGDV